MSNMATLTGRPEPWYASRWVLNDYLSPDRSTMPTDLEQLVSQVRSLSPDEQRRFREVLDEQFASDTAPAQPTEEEFKRQLVETGLLKQIKRPARNPESFRSWEPVTIKGKPLSETIIEERR